MKEVIINYILTAFLGAALTAIFGLVKKLKDTSINKIKENKNEDEAIANAVKILLRNEIKAQCKFYISQDHIAEDDYEELEEAIIIYEALKGNGLVHKYWEQVKELHLK